MARAGNAMQITAVDGENNLFQVKDIAPAELVDEILRTPWMELPYVRQQGKDFLKRRKIDNSKIPWTDQWDQHCQHIWPVIAEKLNVKIHNYMSSRDYPGTAWWVDEPGFTCAIHTDGEMPGAMQLFWIGSRIDLGTAFYNYKKSDALRYQFPMQPNSGYIMINQPDSQGFRKLQWHGMLRSVPANSFRLTSYVWINTQ
jgi:hypothetical protein